MTVEETINSLELLQAEIEWEMPINYSDAIDTALEYLKKIRDGKMFELPCKIGEYAVWDNGANYRKIMKVQGFIIDYMGVERLDLGDIQPIFNHQGIVGIYSTKEEAEKNLKEIEND